MQGKAEAPFPENKASFNEGQTGVPADPQNGHSLYTDPAKQQQTDQSEPLGHLRSIPFEQAREAFLLLLRETGRGDMEYVCRNVLRNVWDADVVRDKVEKRNA